MENLVKQSIKELKVLRLSISTASKQMQLFQNTKYEWVAKRVADDKLRSLIPGSDGLVFHPRGVKGPHPLNTTETADKHRLHGTLGLQRI